MNAGTTGTIAFVNNVGGLTAVTNFVFTNAALITIGGNITMGGANLLHLS